SLPGVQSAPVQCAGLRVIASCNRPHRRQAEIFAADDPQGRGNSHAGGVAMSAAEPILPPSSGALDADMLRRLERLGLTGHPDQWTERYVLCEKLVDPAVAEPRQEFEACSRFIRDLVAHRWAKTRRERGQANPKRIHYLSMEFLLGRTLRNNMMNLAAEPLVEHALKQQGWDLQAVLEEEPDAGLGNGGLGRLAACFIDSLATLQYPAIGYGLRYE